MIGQNMNNSKRERENNLFYFYKGVFKKNRVVTIH